MAGVLRMMVLCFWSPLMSWSVSFGPKTTPTGP
ncbi:hypothetical protein [Gluconobacter morbifer]